MPGRDKLVMGRQAKPNPLMYHIKGAQLVPVIANNTCFSGFEIHPPGCRNADLYILCYQPFCQFLRDLACHLIFGSVAFFRPGTNQRCYPLAPKGLYQCGIQHAAFGNAFSAQLAAMGKYRPKTFIYIKFCKYHGRLPCSLAWPACARHAAISSARMETAISAGDFAPISKPAGPLIRAI